MFVSLLLYSYIDVLVFCLYYDVILSVIMNFSDECNIMTFDELIERIDLKRFILKKMMIASYM